MFWRKKKKYLKTKSKFLAIGVKLTSYRLSQNVLMISAPILPLKKLTRLTFWVLIMGAVSKYAILCTTMYPWVAPVISNISWGATKKHAWKNGTIFLMGNRTRRNFSTNAILKTRAPGTAQLATSASNCRKFAIGLKTAKDRVKNTGS